VSYYLLWILPVCMYKRMIIGVLYDFYGIMFFKRSFPYCVIKK